MKFIFPDSLDYVDPGYDFINDEYTAKRTPYWDDKFSHEIYDPAPFDGLLVSRAVMGSSSGPNKTFTQSQEMRFMRDGAQKFYRFNKRQSEDLLLFGDCGAFTYANMESPPYSPAEMVEFYNLGGFTHGCSIDHIIFEFSKEGNGSEDARRRFGITLDLAEKFINEHERQKAKFTPIGVAQGWSPASLAEATSRLLELGFRYIAIGGLVPLGIGAIRSAVHAVSSAMSSVPDGKIHLLGFAKSEAIDEFSQFNVASFDSTSPFRRAFKDHNRNYWLEGSDGKIDYYSAIRVPQTYANNTLKREVQRGIYSQEELAASEARALQALRSYDIDHAGLDETLDAVLSYARFLLAAGAISEEKVAMKLDKLRSEYARTLSARPWKSCKCNICVDCSIEVIIFRASNRNKRRGMHNLFTFHNHTKGLLQGEAS